MHDTTTGDKTAINDEMARTLPGSSVSWGEVKAVAPSTWQFAECQSESQGFHCESHPKMKIIFNKIYVFF